MKIIKCAQHSTAWDEARRGIPTSSKFNLIVTSQGEPSKQAVGYLYTLAARRMSRFDEPSYQSKAMEEGNKREEESRLVYAMLKEIEVQQIGFCLADSGLWGCSPDGLVGEDGLVEFKNCLGKTAVEYLLANKLPTAYVQQVQGQLLVTRRSFCDFVSYYPGLPTMIVRVERDEEFLEKLEKQLIFFCQLLDELCEKIKEGK